MSKHYSASFLRMLRNQIKIDEVIIDVLNIQVRNDHEILRFRCPLCGNFHTASNQETNLARCFDCKINFNPIDLVMTVGDCGFLDAVNILKVRINQ